MTAKEQLRQLSTLNQRIEQRRKLVEYYMEQAEKMGGALSQVGVVTGTKTQSPMTDCVDKAIDLAADIAAEMDALKAERRLICGIVERIPDARYKPVLELRYFAPRTPIWEDIAEEMGIDVRHVHRLHGEALVQFSLIAG
jgi:DNA-directed RNA polymerase specialized sigma subunit